MSLEKIGAKSVLDLALLTPKAYHNYILKPHIEDKNEAFLEVELLKEIKGGKFYKVEAYAKNINRMVELLFFKTTPYHYSTFKAGSTLYISGKVNFFKKIQIIQPKKIAAYKIGRIYPEYKTPLRADIFERLKEEYLTKEALIEEEVPDKIADSLLKIHYPDERFYEEFKKRGDFWGEYLYALKFLEAFRYFKALKGKRKRLEAVMSCKGELDGFIKNLPFKLTSDQLKALEDIKSDMASKFAAKRVIVGDVGSGKSVVMFGAAYLAYPNRAILMAPTSILANQLYQEAKRLLPPHMKIALVSAKTSVEDLERYDFIIGTHALLYRKLPTACVVMVDEQHRFGTEQRQKLKKLVQKSRAPHFFQFSATPIPRTKAMMQSALVDFSFIKQTPFKKDIETHVISKEDFKELLAHIKKETSQGRQVLIVYPLVEESENFEYKSLEEAREFWQKYFDFVYVTHGKDSQKDEVLEEFRDKGKILLATTVVEVGISLPKLSTIVVVGAENMGLATLHQLRGRVSRTGLKGYCFLYTNDKNNKRLVEFGKLKSGFDIAELDLKFRKSGDILSGKEQSGKAFRWLSLAEDAEIVSEVKKRLIHN